MDCKRLVMILQYRVRHPASDHGVVGALTAYEEWGLFCTERSLAANHGAATPQTFSFLRSDLSQIIRTPSLYLTSCLLVHVLPAALHAAICHCGSSSALSRLPHTWRLLRAKAQVFVSPETVLLP